MTTAQKNKFKYWRLAILAIAFLIGLTTVYMMTPIFGKRPSGTRLEKIKKSPNYRDGKFRNMHDTPQLTQGFGLAMYEYFFKKSDALKPQRSVPSKTIHWKTVTSNQASLVWLGHSSYLLRIEGVTILVDPVLSGSASPIPGGGKAFKGADVIAAAMLPAIDYLVISHDHYDHLDYKTLKELQPKVGKVITGLGVGAHLEHWGYRNDQIIETDWWDETEMGNGFRMITTPARHFSGRSIWSANTLWASFVLQTPTRKIYLGGDSGYDTHFKEIGAKYGPFDWAILENGQYDLSWKYIHMQPEEVIQAYKDLRASILLPVHSSKFVLANHAWYEPLERITQLGIQENIPVLTPMIGEVIDLDNSSIRPNFWWRNTGL